MQENWKKLLSLVPDGPNWEIDWDSLEKTELEPIFVQMGKTKQNPQWHGEGDVMTHTRMVADAGFYH